MSTTIVCITGSCIFKTEFGCPDDNQSGSANPRFYRSAISTEVIILNVCAKVQAPNYDFASIFRAVLKKGTTISYASASVLRNIPHSTTGPANRAVACEHLDAISTDRCANWLLAITGSKVHERWTATYRIGVKYKEKRLESSYILHRHFPSYWITGHSDDIATSRLRQVFPRNRSKT